MVRFSFADKQENISLLIQQAWNSCNNSPPPSFHPFLKLLLTRRADPILSEVQRKQCLYFGVKEWLIEWGYRSVVVVTLIDYEGGRRFDKTYVIPSREVTKEQHITMRRFEARKGRYYLPYGTFPCQPLNPKEVEELQSARYEGKGYCHSISYYDCLSSLDTFNQHVFMSYQFVMGYEFQ